MTHYSSSLQFVCGLGISIGLFYAASNYAKLRRDSENVRREFLIKSQIFEEKRNTYLLIFSKTTSKVCNNVIACDDKFAFKKWYESHNDRHISILLCDVILQERSSYGNILNIADTLHKHDLKTTAYITADTIGGGAELIAFAAHSIIMADAALLQSVTIWGNDYALFKRESPHDLMKIQEKKLTSLQKKD